MSPDDGREPVSVLSLAWRVRKGEPDGSRTRREFLDFVVDGESLRDMLGESDRVGWLSDWRVPPSIAELLPDVPSRLESVIDGATQRLLYICPECGDEQCGAVTGVIVEEHDRIVWKEFAHLWWEPRDWSPVFDTEPFAHIGPFIFDREQYVNALLNPPPRPQ